MSQSEPGPGRPNGTGEPAEPAADAPLADGEGPVRQGGLLGSSAIMAAGTVVSRLTGFVRAAVVAAAIGLGAAGDAFNLPNTVPNMIYILVAGGVLNAVLVPALVKSIKQDADGGEAYAQRLFSLVVVVLGIATIAAAAAAPWIMRAIADSAYLEPENRAFFDNMVLFARFCLPQIFFYGVYVLIGQMLNARSRFGPMMWAPIVNNVVAIAVFGGFIAVAGTKADDEPFTTTEVAVLGLGSTLGVALQALILLPVLIRAGFTLRFRTDWRGTGLAQVGRLGLWTLALVIANQVAYVIVIRTASAGSAAGEAGATVYMNAMLIMMVPHAIITVSLATALLPKLADHATDGALQLVVDRLESAMRVCLAVMVPIAALLAAMSVPLAALIFDYGAASGTTRAVAVTFAALMPGLVAFTVHYLTLRGFYALQDTRTPFLVQVWIAAAMIVNALLVVQFAPASQITVWLAAGFSAAYVLGSAVSLSVLRRRLGGPSPTALLLHVGHVLIPAVLAAGASYGTVRMLGDLGLPGWLDNLVVLTAAGTIGLALYIVMSYVLRVAAVREAIGLIRSRLGRRRSGAGPNIEGRT